MDISLGALHVKKGMTPPCYTDPDLGDGDRYAVTAANFIMTALCVSGVAMIVLAGLSISGGIPATTFGWTLTGFCSASIAAYLLGAHAVYQNHGVEGLIGVAVPVILHLGSIALGIAGGLGLVSGVALGASYFGVLGAGMITGSVITSVACPELVKEAQLGQEVRQKIIEDYLTRA